MHEHKDLRGALRRRGLGRLEDPQAKKLQRKADAEAGLAGAAAKLELLRELQREGLTEEQVELKQSQLASQA